ncbi:MAG TPA: hypothetical protein VGJ74_16650 [Burkholderiales bacterium]|jgi:hypothetical protein
MGLLDDLKRQADLQRTQTSLQRSLREENVRAVDEAMHRAFLYLHDLFKQLAVLMPVNPVVYAMRGIGEFRDLRYGDSFIDARKKKIGERDVYDYTDFWIKWTTPNALAFTREMPHEIAKAREVLRHANLKFTEEEKKTPGGPVLNVKFFVPGAVTVDFTVRADHDQRRVLFYGKNALQLGIDDFVVPADELTEAMVEEFAKLLLGQPNDFARRYRTVLPRK